MSSLSDDSLGGEGDEEGVIDVAKDDDLGDGLAEDVEKANEDARSSESSIPGGG